MGQSGGGITCRPGRDAGSIYTASVPWVDEFLDHNELGVAMDALVDAALASPTRAIPEAAIHHIRLASAQMDGYVPNNWDEFISRFGSHSRTLAQGSI